jgi:hypothetical protein
VRTAYQRYLNIPFLAFHASFLVPPPLHNPSNTTDLFFTALHPRQCGICGPSIPNDAVDKDEVGGWALAELHHLPSHAALRMLPDGGYLKTLKQPLPTLQDPAEMPPTCMMLKS